MGIDQYTMYQGTFNPKRLDTLRDDARKYIGHCLWFQALWIVDDEQGGVYLGQWVFTMFYNKDRTSRTSCGWVPEEDIEFTGEEN